LKKGQDRNDQQSSTLSLVSVADSIGAAERVAFVVNHLIRIFVCIQIKIIVLE